MKENDREKVFVGKVLSALDQSARELDPETLARLRHIRARALERGRSRVWTGLGPLFRFPAAGFATAAVILLAAFLYLVNPFDRHRQNGFDASEILVTNENLEFYEDLDFYKWLTEETGRGDQEIHSRKVIPARYASWHAPEEIPAAPGEDEKPGAIGLKRPYFRVG